MSSAGTSIVLRRLTQGGTHHSTGAALLGKRVPYDTELVVWMELDEGIFEVVWFDSTCVRSGFHGSARRTALPDLKWTNLKQCGVRMGRPFRKKTKKNGFNKRINFVSIYLLIRGWG